MKKLIPTLLALFVPAFAAAEELPNPYAFADITWKLESIDGAPFAASSTLTFPEEGRVGGQAPCNLYFGDQTALFPEFRLDALGMTKMACDDLGYELAYFVALDAMRWAEMDGQTLTLSDGAEGRMVFKALE
jgi:heat shock protein HslJ